MLEIANVVSAKGGPVSFSFTFQVGSSYMGGNVSNSNDELKKELQGLRAQLDEKSQRDEEHWAEERRREQHRVEDRRRAEEDSRLLEAIRADVAATRKLLCTMVLKTVPTPH